MFLWPATTSCSSRTVLCSHLHRRIYATPRCAFKASFHSCQEGFKPNQVLLPQTPSACTIYLQSLLHHTRPERGTTVFPRLWVRITCSSWPGTPICVLVLVVAMSLLRSHREKRTSKSTSGHNRHTVAGPLGRACLRTALRCSERPTSTSRC